MNNDRLNILRTAPEQEQSFLGKKLRRGEVQAYYDRVWKVAPEHLDPRRNIMERVRLERTLELIQRHLDLKGKKCVDLACGNGVFSRMLRDAGAHVDAVDVSPVALKLVEEGGCENIVPIRDYVPMTTLKDEEYDLVVCTQLIAELKEDEFRLLFSELARLVKGDGYVVCSTELDINSENPLQMFNDLAETEIQIEEWVVCYHRLWIRLKDFFEAPFRFVKASQDREYRHRELRIRRGFSHWWFETNSHPVLALFWRIPKILFSPVLYLIKQNRAFLLFLEKACRFLFSGEGISQGIFIGKRRPLFIHPAPDEIPKVPKHKKQVWE